MRPITAGWALSLILPCCLFVPFPSAGTLRQVQIRGSWTDSRRSLRSRADLEKILALHRLWIESHGVSGTFADLSSADLRDADLIGVQLEKAHLGGARLSGAHLGKSHLSGADLARADLSDADLSGADLTGADLTGVSLRGANLRGTIFQPTGDLQTQDVAYADGLEELMYESDPKSLTSLRKQFEDAGFRQQERALTCALNREDARRNWAIEHHFKHIAFDLTSRYGLNPWRPLGIFAFVWLLCSVVYTVFMNRSGPSGIYLMGSRLWRGKTNTQGISIRPRAIRGTKWRKPPFRWLRREWRIWRLAMLFSLMSAFNIGFRDINLGRWLLMLTKREYDLKAVGWARTVSGCQSLLSVYLVALWVLTFFGKPFR